MTPLPGLLTTIAILGISAAALSAGEKAGAPAGQPRVFLLDGRLLAETRARAAADKSLAHDVEELRRDADKELRAGPFPAASARFA